MSASDEEVDRLEEYLDGALDAAAANDLVARLSRDAELTSRLRSLRDERAVRKAIWTNVEPTDVDVSRLVERVNAASKRRFRMSRPVRFAAAIAACVLLTFFAGWKARDHQGSSVVLAPTHFPIGMSVGPKVETIVSYQVALIDENGRVTALQTFDSLDKAREFANDLGRWQDRQHQMRDGAAVVVADRF